MPSNPIPRWPDSAGSPRALVECQDAAVQDGLARALRESGYSVATCGGPETRASHTCPLVTEGRCGLVEDADVVVHALDSAAETHRTVLYAIRDRVPDTPVVVEVTAADRDDARAAGYETVRYPVSRQALLDALVAATDR
jgi:hypothetical protein